MKTLLLLFVVCIISCASSYAQTSNPYSSLKKKSSVLTLTNGKYKESYDDDAKQRIGSVIIDTRTRKIVQIMNADSIVNSASDNTTASRWISVDPLVGKYPNISPYAFSVNSPIVFKDPDGKDVLLMIWGSNGGDGIGHSAIAISNYVEVKQKVMEHGHMVTRTTMVPDGTYTVRDLWPGVPAGKHNYYKNLPASYSADYRGKKFTLEELKSKTINNEKRPADGILHLKTDYKTDQLVNTDLNYIESSHPSYNGMNWNCSDYASEGFSFGLGSTLNSKETTSSGVSVTTPNELYKSAKGAKGVTVDKDAGTATNGSSLEKATEGHVDKAVKKAQ